ncbi:MAG: fibronectin type III domain-containing protein [Chitinophagaceae bacterium]|nr:fibronectin type III domain-containing protein [Chitinophagaceae bacterium]
MRKNLLCLFLTATIVTATYSQNVFNPNDPQIRYDSTAPLGSQTRPNPAILGLQKWVSVPTNGISSSFDASSYKAYYINVGGRRMPFRLKFPFSYSNPDSANKRYPMMMFFHGAGEPGCPSNGGIYNNEKQLLHGGKTFMDRVNNNQFDGFLFYPQAFVTNCSNFWGTAYDVAINAVLDSLMKYVRFDEDRLFVNGLSDGGRTTWRYARTFPTRVARVAPSAMSAMTSSLTSMIHIPVWFATGGRDTNPSPEQAQETLTIFTNLGGNIRYTQYPNLGHGVWNNHWAEPDYVPYMNGTHKAQPLVYFNHYDWCVGQTIAARIALTPGFNGYEFEREGVVIARRLNGVNTILVSQHVTSMVSGGNEITVRSLGTYRVRFRRTSTSAWSAWSPQPVVIGIKGTTITDTIFYKSGLQSKIVPAPDGKNTVTLQINPGFLNYQWYRSTDLTLLSNTDTLAAPAGTYRVRYSELFGCSTVFSPNFKVYSTATLPKPDPATNLTAVPTSTSRNQLNWQSNAAPTTNEKGFEIYRATTSGGPYALIAITNADASSFSDNNLASNTPYYYIVRAVTDSAAADVSNEAASKTIKDITPPAAPLRLEYRGATQNSVSMRWSSSSGTSRYDIYINGVKTYSTEGTSYTVRNLDSLTTYVFTIKAVDAAGNVSAPSAQLVAFTHRQGLNYKYVTGQFSTLPNFNTLPAVRQGIVDSVNTGTKFRTSQDNYAILWTGYLFVPESSTYTFETNSDEGSRFYIDQGYAPDAEPLIDNDGLHTATSKTAEITLTRGYHQIAVTYFERTGTETMELFWSNTTGNFGRRRIADMYYSYVAVPNAPPVIAPSDLAATTVDFKSIRLNWVDNSPNETGFELMRANSSTGTYTPFATVPANTTTFTNVGLSSATTYFFKMRAVGSENESPITDFVSATTDAAPGTPLAPNDLQANNIATNRITISWTNNSTNETSIEVWRGTDNLNFSLLTTLPARANIYTDNSVTAFTQYYYFVRGVNANGNGEQSESLGVIAGNNAPVITAVNNMFVKTDATVQQNFSITDAGDNVTVSIPNKPSFITLQNLGSNNYRIVAAPTIDNIGWHNLAVTARDSKGAITVDSFTVSVADKSVRSFYINLGNAAEIAPAPWNNWGGVRAANSTRTQLRDETNAVTALSVTFVSAWQRLTELGHITGNNTGVVPDSALRSGIADSTTTAKTIRFNGLNNSMRYNIVFVGSQNEGLLSRTVYTIGTQRDTMVSTFNTQQTAQLNTLTPTSGAITVTATRLTGVSYLNAIILEEYSPSITLLNPVNLYAEALNRTTIDLSWSDRTNSEATTDGYQLQRATDSLFTLNVATFTLRGNVTTFRNTGLNPNTKYWYRVRAKSGSTFSAYSNRAKAITPANIVAVNFNVDVTNAPSPWNNLQNPPDDFETFDELINQNLQISGVTLRIEAPFNGEFNAGHTTGNNSGVVPDLVLRSNYWIDKTQLAQIRISGLNTTRRYRFGFVGSAGPNGWFKDNYTAAYSINGRTVYLNAWTNTSKVVWIGDVLPDESGEVLLNFSTTQAALYAFNAGVLIEDYTDVQGGSALNSVVEVPAELIEEPKEGRIYPNPFNESFNVDIYNSSSSNRITTEVYDVAGRIVQRRDFKNVSAGNNTLRVDQGQSLKPGVYIVMVKVNGKIVNSGKLVKVKK